MAAPASPTVVCFACIKNAGRSQMSAAFLNALIDPAAATAVSAGSAPASEVHPGAAGARMHAQSMHASTARLRGARCMHSMRPQRPLHPCQGWGCTEAWCVRPPPSPWSPIPGLRAQPPCGAPWCSTQRNPSPARSPLAGPPITSKCPPPPPPAEVVVAMHEVGIDVAGKVPTKLTEELIKSNGVTLVFTMGCGDKCPYGAGGEPAKQGTPSGAGMAARRGGRLLRRALSCHGPRHARHQGSIGAARHSTRFRQGCEPERLQPSHRV
jgi:protein-tyrosine-phosphatase